MNKVTEINSAQYYDKDYITELAREKFGIEYLYPWQRLVIANIVESYFLSSGIIKNNFYEETDSYTKGRQIILLPTGAGKSLCFQVPAFIFEGPTLIIYPLLALMTDQQRRMEDGSLGCVVFRGGQTENERNENFEKIKAGAKIILANPEVLQNQNLLNKLCKIGISHIAIDEAHCVSQWGDTFRPSYLKLGQIIKQINPPVVSAFTATASPAVLTRISEILFDGESHLVRGETDRKNIYYYVRNAVAKKKEVLRLVKSELHPMIVFCGTRGMAEEMAQEINVCFGQGYSKFYHAGLNKEEKTEVENWFFDSKDGVLCATCAYGMGVDKKDIKTVVILEVYNVEDFVQQAGRGGRDNSVAKAFLIWSLEDSIKFSKYNENSREAEIKKFAETKECRRQVLLNALGGEETVCSGCDLCLKRESIKKINSLYGKKLIPKRKYKQSLKSLDYVSDWQEAYYIIKKHKNTYTEEEAENVLYEKMSSKDEKNININIWTHGDSVDIIKQLEKSNKIKIKGTGWKNKLSPL